MADTDQHKDPVVDNSLTGWVMNHVSEWENHRKQNYDEKWAEFYRLWRGIWKETDKLVDSERSKLINPALSQAVESTAGEIEESFFGKGKWFDVSDDYADKNKEDVKMWRNQMNEDLDAEGVPDALSEIFLLSSIYGTGIGKIVLKEVTEQKIVAEKIGESDVQSASIEFEKYIRVGLKAIDNTEFVIDPTATNIDQALGMAHITTVPKHLVQQGQADGTYMDVPISSFSETVVGNNYNGRDTKDLTTTTEADRTLIVEYHGFVPRELLEGAEDDNLEIEELFPDEMSDDFAVDETDMVESIVTIANGDTLLRAVKNPYLMGDRCFIAYQHDTVPNRFWGRGVCEKGYSPQKALDAELRGRIDAMSLSIRPMMAIDATRIQRGADFRVSPGKNIFTNGDPKSILMPFTFGQVNPTTFGQSADLERQIQMGTGAMDSATPVGENRRNETAGGMSMIQGGSIKRTKRTLSNISRNFLSPFIHKASWRFMQFAPEKYPATDIQFQVHSRIGMMARELESQQMGALMSTVPKESPAFWMLLKGVFENSSMNNREEMLGAVDMMMKKSIKEQQQPPKDPIILIKIKEIEVDAQLEQAKLKQKGDMENKELQLEVAKLELEQQKLALKREEIVLNAKVDMAKMEQDSMVTVAQMSQKQVEINKPTPAKGSGKGGSPARKKISVKQTPEGLVGTSEEILEPVEQPVPKKTTMSVARTPGGFTGTSEPS